MTVRSRIYVLIAVYLLSYRNSVTLLHFILSHYLRDCFKCTSEEVSPIYDIYFNVNSKESMQLTYSFFLLINFTITQKNQKEKRHYFKTLIEYMSLGPWNRQQKFSVGISIKEDKSHITKIKRTRLARSICMCL